MSPSSSRSDAFGFLVARGPVAAATSGPAWLQAMLDAEAALAGAQADIGEIPDAAAESIAAACHIDRFDVDAVLADAASGGNAVIPLVARLRESVGAELAPYVHLHATSQDIADATARPSHQRAVTALNVDGTAYWPNVRLIIGLAP